MAELIRMPEVLAGATEGAIQTWRVVPGEAVALDQTIAEIETEKAVVELTAEVAGTIGRLIAAEGDTIAVGDPLFVMLAADEGEEAVNAALASAGVSDATPGAAVPQPENAPAKAGDGEPAAPAANAPRTPEHAPPAGRRLFASPLVRRLAAEHGVDVAAVAGSGPNGRVVRRDLERHLAADAAAAPTRDAASSPEPSRTTPDPLDGVAPYEDVPLDRMRRAIARRLTESKSTVPHFYLTTDCRVDALLTLRGEVNAAATRKVSVNDFVLKAVAGALTDVPEANAIWNGDSIRRFSSVDISVAVATDGGLTTPVIRGVERLPLTAVSEIVAELASTAREGRLRQHQLEGGSFAVSNLGMYGTPSFSAILNPPQSGILAVGAARQAPVVDADGRLAAGMIMTVTLSADHRVLDGAVAAQWLAAFQHRIENPLTILI